MAENNNYLNQTYANLISTAISNFDSIYSELAKKGVDYNGAELTQDLRDGGSLPVSSYASLIQSQLFKISGLAPATKVTHYNSTYEGTLTDPSVLTVDGGTYKVTSIVENAGYYSAGASLSATIETVSVQLSKDATNSLTLNSKQTAYEYNVDGTNNTALVSSVSVAAGELAIAEGSSGYSVSDTSTYSTTLAVGDEEVQGINKDNFVISDSSQTGFISIPLKTDIYRKGKLTAKATPDFVEGYIKDISVGAYTATFGDETTGANVGTNTTRKINIKKGSLKITDTTKEELKNVKASVTSNTIALVSADDKVGSKTYYELQSSIDQFNLNCQVEEGYVVPSLDEQGKPIGMTFKDIQLGTGLSYIQAAEYTEAINLGKDAATGNASIIGITDNDNILAGTGDDCYSVTVAVNGNSKVEISEGYVDENKEVAVAVKENATIKVKQGSYTETLKSTVGAKTNSVTSDTATKYAITLTSTASVDEDNTSFEAGYIKDIATPAVASDEKTIYIKEAKVAAEAGISVTFMNKDNTDGTIKDDADGKLTAASIFVTELDEEKATRDFFKIVSSAQGTVSADGYITNSSEVIKDEKVRYLLKADVEVESLENGEQRLHVKQGGYLPQGYLTDIDTIEGLSTAEVDLKIDDVNTVGNIFLESGDTKDYYKLAVMKHTTKAGYISNSNGTIAGDFYVRKGKVKTSLNISDLTVGNITESTTDGVRSFKIGVSGDVQTTVALVGGTAGYVTEEDLLVNLDDDKGDVVYNPSANVSELGTTVTLNEAELETKALTGLGLSVNIGDVLATGTSAADGYEITPVVDANSTISVGAKSGKSGYIDSKYAQNVAVTDSSITGKKSVFIKKGTGATVSSADGKNITIGVDFDKNISGDYTITLGGTVDVTGAVATGYYEGTGVNSTISTKAVSVNGLNTLSVSHGHVKAEITPSVGLSSDEAIVLVTEEEKIDGAEYVSITSSVGCEKVEWGNSSDGYVKIADPSFGKDREYVFTPKTATSYIATVDLDTTTPVNDDDEIFYEMSVGQTSNSGTVNTTILSNAAEATTKEYSATEAKYSKYATRVSLTPDAMGTSVIAEFSKLAARLAGSYQHDTTV